MMGGEKEGDLPTGVIAEATGCLVCVKKKKEKGCLLSLNWKKIRGSNDTIGGGGRTVTRVKRNLTIIKGPYESEKKS